MMVVGQGESLREIKHYRIPRKSHVLLARTGEPWNLNGDGLGTHCTEVVDGTVKVPSPTGKSLLVNWD